MSFNFISGAYSVTWNSQDLGQIEDGITFEYNFHGEPVRGDDMGDTTEDFVFRGGDCFCQMVLNEYNTTGLMAAWWPWANFGEVGLPGILANANKAKALVLTALAGTPAQLSAAPATLTANQAILAPGFPVTTLFAPRLRRVPIRFQLLPYDNLGTLVWFTTT